MILNVFSYIQKLLFVFDPSYTTLIYFTFKIRFSILQSSLRVVWPKHIFEICVFFVVDSETAVYTLMPMVMADQHRWVSLLRFQCSWNTINDLTKAKTNRNTITLFTVLTKLKECHPLLQLPQYYPLLFPLQYVWQTPWLTAIDLIEAKEENVKLKSSLDSIHLL